MVQRACSWHLAALRSNNAGSNSNATTTSSATAQASAFFKGKTITLIARDAPGGGYDLYARLIAPAFGKILGATVTVENVVGAGTVVGTNQMAASTPDGLTLGMVNVGGDLASVIEKSQVRTSTWLL